MAAARAAIERGFIGIVFGRASVRAEQDQPGKVSREAHHAKRSVVGERLLLEGKARPCDPLLVARGGAGIEFVLAAQDVDKA